MEIAQSVASLALKLVNAIGVGSTPSFCKGFISQEQLCADSSRWIKIFKFIAKVLGLGYRNKRMQEKETEWLETGELVTEPENRQSPVSHKHRHSYFSLK